MNKALLEQLALAKEAGTKAMAKDFFAKPESAVEEAPAEENAEGELTPEQLQELLAMLEQENSEHAEGLPQAPPAGTPNEEEAEG